MSEDVHTFNFLHLTLREAEDQLVGACVRHPFAIDFALEMLPETAIRTGREKRAVLGMLLRWDALGEYDAATNEERLIDLFGKVDKQPGQDRDWWIIFLDSLWVPWTAVPKYAHDLCAAVAEHYRLNDASVIAARRMIYENPLQVDDWIKDIIGPALPPSARKQPERGTLDAFKR